MRSFSLLAAVSTAGLLVGLVIGSTGAAQRQGQRSGGGRQQGAQPAQQQASTAAAPAAAAVPTQCIPEAAKRDFEACPAGARGGKMRLTGGAPQSRLQTTKRDIGQTERGREGPTVEHNPADELRARNLQVRARALLDREVELLKRLVRNTRQADPRRPDILLRLAETLAELQTALNAAMRGFDDPLHQACRVQKNRDRCREVREGQTQAQQALEAAREEAINTYVILARDHPDYRAMDQVLFALAFNLELMRRQEQARQVYHRLIKGFPESRFIPHAYLSFAEFFFNEGEMRPSIQFYAKVLEFPPERNSVYGYALYKSAWALFNLEDYRGSLEKFVQVIEFADAHSEGAEAQNLARQARKELVLPYSRVGSPNRALEFFRRYARTADDAYEMLENLGTLYYDTGKWPEAIAVFHQLMSDRPTDEKLCHWQTRVTNAVISSKPKNDQLVELRRLVEVYEAYSQGQHPPERLAECKSESASVVAWLATSWHREAVGTDDSPGTNDRETMGLASRLYKLLLDKFPDLDQLEFPTIDRRDWPTRYRLAYYMAELLWKMEDWEKCGPAFDMVVELNPQGEYTNDAAYAAVLCYNNLYQQQYQGRERQTREEQSEAAADRNRRRARGQADEAAVDYAPRELTDIERRMIAAFNRYVCYIQGSEELPQIKYRRARIYYESNHFEEAAFLFRDIAWNNRDSELAEFAANLYLDCLNVMGSMRQPPNPSCLVDMEGSLPDLKNMYCATPELAAEREGLCRPIELLTCQVMRKTAEALHTRGRFKEAGIKYVDIIRNHRECHGLEGMEIEELYWNAALDFEAARLIGLAIRIRTALVETYPDHNLAKRSLYLIGANYHALAFYEQAATYYERFATRFPQEDGTGCSQADRDANLCPIASEALQNAVLFRLGLGNEEQAIDNARLFERNYKRSMPRVAAQVVFSLGTMYERTERWDHVVRHYRQFVRDYGRVAPPHMVLVANAAHARGYWKMEKPDDARRPYEAVVRAWQAGAPRAILGMEDIPVAERYRNLRDALDATAEAIFYLSEAKYQAFRAIHFPRYEGGRSMDRVTRWAQGPFLEWVNEKLAALRVAEAEYTKIATLEVELEGGVKLNSPPWQIAAAARIGQMYRSFVDNFREAPIPEDIENDPELFDAYAGSLEQRSEPLVRQAIDKFEFCLRTATNVRWFNEWSRTCEEELHELNPREYPIAAELRGQPNYVYGTWARPAAVELGTGGDEMSLGGEAAAGDAAVTGGTAAPAAGGGGE